MARARAVLFVSAAAYALFAWPRPPGDAPPPPAIPPPSPSRPLVFLHARKCGGSSVREALYFHAKANDAAAFIPNSRPLPPLLALLGKEGELRRRFGPAAWDDSPWKTAAASANNTGILFPPAVYSLDGLAPHELREIAVFAGHFSWHDVQAVAAAHGNSAEVSCLVNVRDPYDTFLSYVGTRSPFLDRSAPSADASNVSLADPAGPFRPPSNLTLAELSALLDPGLGIPRLLALSRASAGLPPDPGPGDPADPRNARLLRRVAWFRELGGPVGQLLRALAGSGAGPHPWVPERRGPKRTWYRSRAAEMAAAKRRMDGCVVLDFSDPGSLQAVRARYMPWLRWKTERRRNERAGGGVPLGKEAEALVRGALRDDEELYRHARRRVCVQLGLDPDAA